MISTYLEWMALQETSNDTYPRPRRTIPRRRWEPAEPKPKTFAHQFVDGFKAKHPNLWVVLDRRAEAQGRDGGRLG